MAYDAIEPFGGGRGDLQAGIVAATVANVWRGKNQRAMAPADFMPKFEQPKKQTVAEMRDLARLFAEAFAKK